MSLLKFKKDVTLAPRKLNVSEHLREKIMVYGESGTGKSVAIAGLLRCGLKIVVMSTEAGGDGLRSVRADLQNQPELLENLVLYDLPSYHHVDHFLENFSTLEVAPGKKMDDFAPDMIAWDGFSNFQTNYIDHFVLSHDYAGKADKIGSEMRELGLIAGEKDYDAIGRASKRVLDQALNLTRKDGSFPHFYLNCWELEPAVEIQGRVVKDKDKMFRPALLGATRTQIAGYFDFVIRAVRTQKTLGDRKIEYQYVITATSSVGRQRGTTLDNVEPADMEALWKKITASR